MNIDITRRTALTGSVALALMSISAGKAVAAVVDLGTDSLGLARDLGHAVTAFGPNAFIGPKIWTQRYRVYAMSAFGPVIFAAKRDKHPVTLDALKGGLHIKAVETAMQDEALPEELRKPIRDCLLAIPGYRDQRSQAALDYCGFAEMVIAQNLSALPYGHPAVRRVVHIS